MPNPDWELCWPPNLLPLARQAAQESGLILTLDDEPADHAWVTFLPGQAVLHGGPSGAPYALAHELAHVLVAARTNTIRPVSPRTTSDQARALWLLFNAACDVLVDACLDEYGLLPPDHRARGARAYEALSRAEQDDPAFCLSTLRPFYRAHAQALTQLDTPADADLLARQYLAAAEHGTLEALVEMLVEAHCPSSIDWLRLSDFSAHREHIALGSSADGLRVPICTPLSATDFAATLAQHFNTGLPFALLMWDVAGLARINAEHGQAAGDAILQSLGQAAAHSHGQAWFRANGDESYLLIPDALPPDREPLLNATLLTFARASTHLVPAHVRLAIVFYPHEASAPAELLRRLEYRAFAGVLTFPRNSHADHS
ncbi:diguanylate cyclase domain-containing protein [Deinococcus sp. SM5_A1]|uniref:diguanylate cyclase domain-containing protein n=1 Tax=Deinococcus sp. SM5_A1 TaxID=3379094 RepID=UPI00385C0440